jgi:hypothetical protein
MPSSDCGCSNGTGTNLAQLDGRLGGEDRSTKTLLDEQRQAAGVVDVGVAENDVVELFGVEGEGLPVSSVPLLAALDQPAVEEDALTVELDQMTRPGNFARCAVEGEFHGVRALDRDRAATKPPNRRPRMIAR